MTEPVTGGIGGVLGIKVASLAAGFAGGVVSLAFLKSLTRWQAIMAVAVGALTAAYLTPIAIVELGWQDRPEMQNGAAFVLGLVAMNLIPAIKAAAARWIPKAQGDGGTS